MAQSGAPTSGTILRGRSGSPALRRIRETSRWGTAPELFISRHGAGPSRGNASLRSRTFRRRSSQPRDEPVFFEHSVCYRSHQFGYVSANGTTSWLLELPFERGSFF